MPVYIEGLREITRGMEKAGADLEDLKDVMNEIASEATAVITPKLPMRTGKLRRSARPNRAKATARVQIGGARVPYAGPIVWGWPKRHIKPSYAPQKTDDAMEQRIPQILTEGWNRIAERNGIT
ncbi:MAG: hypothetical protein QM655_12600 [Nocardioidaceae bacterium]